MKKIDDSLLLDLPIAMLAERISVYAKSADIHIQDNNVSAAAQRIWLWLSLAGVFIVLVLVAGIMGMWLIVGLIAGAVAAYFTYKPLDRLFLITIPEQRFNQLREYLARLMGNEQLYHPLALVVEEATLAAGLDGSRYDDAQARWEAGQIDDLRFAAEVLAVNPLIWSSVRRTIFDLHFKKAELMTRWAEERMIENPGSLSHGQPVNQGITASFQL